MILYHPKLGTELGDFGIDLPLRDDRSHQVFELLKKSFPKLEFFSLDKLESIDDEDLSRFHSETFIERWHDDEAFLFEMERTYDCSLTMENHHRPLKELRQSIIDQVRATYTALTLSLEKGFCSYLGGGMHHARRDFGSGFCPVNDIVISLRKAQAKGLIKTAVVIDVDAHQGDGTAEVTLGDSSITTFSLHMEKGWPLDCDELPNVPSDYDYGIALGAEESYLNVLTGGLKELEGHSFDAAIIVAGADPYEHDELLSASALKLSKEQMLARDMTLYKWCQERGIPQTWLMAGGYGEEVPAIYAQFLLKVLHLMG
jgi:acetoin utilization deacetylase AcuC-like enzyme